MEADREEPCAAIALPPGMAAALDGYGWARNQVGESGGAVYRLHGKPGAPDLYLKHGQGSVADDILDEASRLRWLAKHLPVPQVGQLVGFPSEAWLLMTAIPGETAYQALEARAGDRNAVVEALADFLRRLHAVPTSDCPFNSDHVHRLALARKRIDAGLVDEEDFDAARRGWTAEQVWQALHRHLPFTPDPVVTHGDFSLDNLLIADGAVVGCIDVGRAGIADRYQDLAILWNCLGEFGDRLQDRFLARYGRPRPDPAKMEFHLLLDELF
jgi:aminoglycoside 3'-phosphotransferase I